MFLLNAIIYIYIITKSSGNMPYTAHKYGCYVDYDVYWISFIGFAEGSLLFGYA